MFYIFGFYKFKRLSSLKRLKRSFEENFKNNVRGTIIFQKKELMELFLEKKICSKINKNLKNICKIKKFDSENNSTSNFQPFHRGKIKIKRSCSNRN